MKVNQTRRIPYKSWLNQSWILLAMPMLLFIIIPLVSLFTRTSLSDFWSTLNQQQVIQAISLSIFTSLITMLVSVAFGTPVAYLLSQPRFRFHGLVDTLVDLPYVLPPAVAGIALLMTFGRRGLLGGWLADVGLSIPFTTLAVIMAETFIASPFYIKAAAVGFAGIDPELKQAAALDGANRWQTFRFVILPLAWISLVSGCVMTLARALGEFGATIIFAGNYPGRTQTMPLAIYIGFELDLNVALTLSIILICFSFLTLILVKGILHHQVDHSIESDST